MVTSFSLPVGCSIEFFFFLKDSCNIYTQRRERNLTPPAVVGLYSPLCCHLVAGRVNAADATSTQKQSKCRCCRVKRSAVDPLVPTDGTAVLDVANILSVNMNCKYFTKLYMLFYRPILLHRV